MQSYTATVLHAAKSLGKGLRELGETVASSLSGASVGGTQHITSSSNTDLVQPGVVTILDLQVIISKIRILSMLCYNKKYVFYRVQIAITLTEASLQNQSLLTLRHIQKQ